MKRWYAGYFLLNISVEGENEYVVTAFLYKVNLESNQIGLGKDLELEKKILLFFWNWYYTIVVGRRKY